MVEISIVIPTLNEEGTIERMLKTLKEQMYPHDEIIVVDGHSTDRTVEICEKYGVTVYQMDRLGIGPAKTYGAERATKDIVAFLDCDGCPDPFWMARLRLIFTDRRTNAVAGLGLYESESKLMGVIYNIFAGAVFKIAEFFYWTEKIPWMPVNNCALRKEALFKYQGFGPVQCEDLDFSMRARGLPGMRYDRFLRVWLSDRRFVADGFVKTVLLWLRTDLSILDGEPPDSAGYRTGD